MGQGRRKGIRSGWVRGAGKAVASDGRLEIASGERRQATIRFEILEGPEIAFERLRGEPGVATLFGDGFTQPSHSLRPPIDEDVTGFVKSQANEKISVV